MTLDGHEDWVRWGRNRVGLWGRHAAWGWGWMRFVGVFWWLEGVSNQQFFFPHGCKTRSWIAHISHIHDVQRMPQVVHCLSEKDTPQRTCVIKCDGCTILMIWHLYTHTIFDVYIYIYLCTCQQKGYILYVTSMAEKPLEKLLNMRHAGPPTSHLMVGELGSADLWRWWFRNLVRKPPFGSFWMYKTLENNDINCQPQLAKLLKDISTSHWNQVGKGGNQAELFLPESFSGKWSVALYSNNPGDITFSADGARAYVEKNETLYKYSGVLGSKRGSIPLCLIRISIHSSLWVPYQPTMHGTQFFVEADLGFMTQLICLAWRSDAYLENSPWSTRSDFTTLLEERKASNKKGEERKT